MPDTVRKCIAVIESRVDGTWSARITRVEETTRGISGPRETVIKAVLKDIRDFDQDGVRELEELAKRTAGVEVVTGRTVR